MNKNKTNEISAIIEYIISRFTTIQIKHMAKAICNGYVGADIYTCNNFYKEQARWIVAEAVVAGRFTLPE